MQKTNLIEDAFTSPEIHFAILNRNHVHKDMRFSISAPHSRWNPILASESMIDRLRLYSSYMEFNKGDLFQTRTLQSEHQLSPYAVKEIYVLNLSKQIFSDKNTFY
ncbi:hypothetical protein Bhyg_05544 [Pseudolycoriella hygida]|uniref:Uncharacterized protein n=1 Tax=Pseudolycoriella hygida TaxID=35572 RepID=A0A9Q0MZ45_9DIPT|nr:hypothetical protein Bhyg_05544 [Pseudolycoriella hygida]